MSIFRIIKQMLLCCFLGGILLTVPTQQIQAQMLTKENKIEVTKDAKGYLGNVSYDDASKTFKMYFVTKEKKKSLRFYIYTFDYDLNLVSEEEEVQELEKVKTKYKWVRYKGEDETVYEGVTVSATLTGTAQFQKKEIIKKYNWGTGGYTYKTKLGEKLKPKSDEGKKMFFYGGRDLNETGEAMGLVGLKPEKRIAEMGKEMMHYRVIKVDKNLDVVSQDDLVLESIHYPTWIGNLVDGETGEISDMIAVLVPFKASGYKKIAKVPNQYVYVRIGTDGKIKEHISFTTKLHTWKVVGAYEKAGQVVLYGPGKNDKVEKTFYKGQSPQAMEKGFDAFQMASFRDGKLSFITAPTFDEFKAKARKPEGQKKDKVYDGRTVAINGLDILNNGEIFVHAQDWKIDPLSKTTGVVYDEVYVFHFGKDGILKHAYGIENPQRGWGSNATVRGYPLEAITYEGVDGNYWWLSVFVKTIYSYTSDYYSTATATYKVTTYEPRYQALFGKINDNGTAKFNVLGGENVYLYNKYPTLSVNGGNEVIFLGFEGNKKGANKGKVFWLGKFDPKQAN
ncbi:hypothetical protein KFE98_18370 [bacterium SCSIO 12741]|nr:hypothetical protein KFE98_18370 [bacterium SCSIO 12741]